MTSLEELLNGLVLGVHLLSAHSAPGMNDSNPGLYVRTASGFTAGFYENSLSGTDLNGNAGHRRTSRYVGWTWETAGRGFAITLGAVDGYGNDSEGICSSGSPGPNPGLPMGKQSVPAQATASASCTYYETRPRVRDVLPLAVLSANVPLAQSWSARLGYVYVPADIGTEGRFHVATLMLEMRFR